MCQKTPLGRIMCNRVQTHLHPFELTFKPLTLLWQDAEFRCQIGKLCRQPVNRGHLIGEPVNFGVQFVSFTMRMGLPSRARQISDRTFHPRQYGRHGCLETRQSLPLFGQIYHRIRSLRNGGNRIGQS